MYGSILSLTVIAQAVLYSLVCIQSSHADLLTRVSCVYVIWCTIRAPWVPRVPGVVKRVQDRTFFHTGVLHT